MTRLRNEQVLEKWKDGENAVSPGGSYHSQTTSCHVGKARAIANHTMHPVVFNNSEFKNDKD